MTDISELITIANAAKLKGMRRQSIYNAINRKALSLVLVDGEKFLLRAEVEAYKPYRTSGPRGDKRAVTLPRATTTTDGGEGEGEGGE